MIPRARFGQTAANGFLKLIGITDKDAQYHVSSSLEGGYLSIPNSTLLKKTAVAERAALMRQIGEYAKAYTRSEGFKRWYEAEVRQRNKPTPPDPPVPMEQQKKEQRESLQKSISEMEANLKTMPADMRAQMKPVVESVQEQLKMVDDPNNYMYSKDMERMHLQNYTSQMASHRAELAEWEKQYPPSPDLLVKQRLKEFLEASRDVDYAATLVPGRNGKMVFARNDYEGKPHDWKLCYRAGKEPVEAARLFATEWLAELK